MTGRAPSAELPPVSGVPTEFCIVCHAGNRPFAPYWPGFLRCVRCGHCQRADAGEGARPVAEVYDEHYFSGGDYLDYVGDRPAMERHFQTRLAFLRQFREAGVLIEVGCAYGFFLALARRYFEVIGFDVATAPVRYAREVLGLDVRQQDFLVAPLPPEAVDAVAIWDTVTLLPRPDLVVERAAAVLRPGGVLCLTTGDVDSPTARLRRQKWRLAHAPNHVHHFSRRSLAHLLERAGLAVERIRYVGARRSVRQVAYRVLVLEREQQRARPSRLYRLIEASGLAGWSFVLNTGDIMLVAARKRG